MIEERLEELGYVEIDNHGWSKRLFRHTETKEVVEVGAGQVVLNLQTREVVDIWQKQAV